VCLAIKTKKEEGRGGENKRKRRREDVKEREKKITGSVFPASALFVFCSTYTSVYPPFSWQVFEFQTGRTSTR